MGGIHRAQQHGDEQQPFAGQQGGRAHHHPREVARRGRQGRHDQSGRCLRVRGAGHREGFRLHGYAGLRPGLGHRPGRRRRQHDLLHHRPRLGLRLQARALAQARHQHAALRAPGRGHGLQLRHRDRRQRVRGAVGRQRSSSWSSRPRPARNPSPKPSATATTSSRRGPSARRCRNSGSEPEFIGPALLPRCAAARRRRLHAVRGRGAPRGARAAAARGRRGDAVQRPRRRVRRAHRLDAAPAHLASTCCSTGPWSASRRCASRWCRACPRGERMDSTVRKAVELGVAVVQPVLAARSVARPKGERAENRRSHWQKIVVSACEQCGRNQVPEVQALVPVGDYRPGASAAKILLSPSSQVPLSKLGFAESEIVLAAGPEAGFTAEEEAASWSRPASCRPRSDRGCCAPRPRRSPRSRRSTRCGATPEDELSERLVAVAPREIHRVAAPEIRRREVDAPAGDEKLRREGVVALYRVEELLGVVVGETQGIELLARLERAVGDTASRPASVPAGSCAPRATRSRPMAAMVARFSGETSASASLISPAIASFAAALRPARTSSIARRLTADESDSAAMRTNVCTRVSTWPSEESAALRRRGRAARDEQ